MANKIVPILVQDEDFSRNLKEYYKAKADKKDAVARENEALNYCCNFLNYTKDNTPGTVRYADGNFELTFRQKTHTEVDVDALFEYAKEQRISISELRTLFDFKLKVKEETFYMLTEEARRPFEAFISTKYDSPDKEIKLIDKEK